MLLGGSPGKHTHAILTLDRGALLFDDSRQFGSIEYTEEFPKRVARLGPEPLEIGVEEFIAALKRRRTSVKALLLNQSFVRGIGNIYADEALFRAGIHPRAMAARLRRDRARKLHGAIREVLAEAIAAGGSSISDYVDAEGRKGFFQFQHRVYQRTGQPCISCGAPIAADLNRAAFVTLLSEMPKALVETQLKPYARLPRHQVRRTNYVRANAVFMDN